MVFNGDIFTRKNFLDIKKKFPQTDTFMLGRGLIADPGLIDVIVSENPEDFSRDLISDKNA